MPDYKPRLKYSQKAVMMLKHLTDFNIEEFEQFMEDNFFIVGDTHLNHFILTKEQELLNQKQNGSN